MRDPDKYNWADDFRTPRRVMMRDKWLLLLLCALVCVACEGPATEAPAKVVACKQAASPSCGYRCLPLPDFTLTPAPPGESLFERWKRTKAEYERQAQLQREIESQVEVLDLPAFSAYNAAEIALQAAECGKVCLPTDPH